MGKGCDAPHLPKGHYSPITPICLPDWKLCNVFFLGFYGGFIMYS